MNDKQCKTLIEIGDAVAALVDAAREEAYRVGYAEGRDEGFECGKLIESIFGEDAVAQQEDLDTARAVGFSEGHIKATEAMLVEQKFLLEDVEHTAFTAGFKSGKEVGQREGRGLMLAHGVKEYWRGHRTGVVASRARAEAQEQIKSWVKEMYDSKEAHSD